jgi:hypothetical protein
MAADKDTIKYKDKRDMSILAGIYKWIRGK